MPRGPKNGKHAKPKLRQCVSDDGLCLCPYCKELKGLQGIESHKWLCKQETELAKSLKQFLDAKPPRKKQKVNAENSPTESPLEVRSIHLFSCIKHNTDTAHDFAYGNKLW